MGMETDREKNLSGEGRTGEKPDRMSQDTPIGGKVNYLKQGIFGRGYGTDEFKYPLRFSDEEQIGPNRKTLETSSNISEKAHEMMGEAKLGVKKILGQTERKDQVR